MARQKKPRLIRPPAHLAVLHYLRLMNGDSHGDAKWPERREGEDNTSSLSPFFRYSTRGRQTPLGHKAKDLGIFSGQFCRRRQISFSLSCLSISAAKEGFPRGELVPLPGGEGCKVPHIVPPLLSLSRGNAGDNKFRLVPRKNIRAAAVPPITKSIDRIRRRLKRGAGG